MCTYGCLTSVASASSRFTLWRLHHSNAAILFSRHCPDFGASILAGKTIATVRVVGNVGFTIMSEPLDAAKQNEVVTYGASVAGALARQVELVGEINGRWSTRSGTAPPGTETRGVVKLGGRYIPHSLSISTDGAVSER